MSNDTIPALCKKCRAPLPENAVFCPMCGKRQAAQEPRRRTRRPNGSGTVYKLSGRRRAPWVAVKGGEVIGYFETRTAALQELDRFACKSVSEFFNLTFSEVYERWKQEHFRRVGDKSIEGYEAAYAHCKALYGKKIRLLRTADYQAVIDAQAEKGRSRSLLEKDKLLMLKLSAWAIREEILTVNYAEYVTLPKAEKKEKEVFTAEELERLSACQSDTATLILLLIYTGMRIGELFSLRVENCHEDYCIGGEKTEAGRNRVIPIPPVIRERYARLRAAAAGKQLLVDGYTGNRRAELFRKRDYYPLLEALQIPKRTPHATRHTFTSMAVAGGVKPELLQKILGHSDYSTTINIYTHFDVNLLVAAVSTLGQPEAQKNAITNT